MQYPLYRPMYVRVHNNRKMHSHGENIVKFASFEFRDNVMFSAMHPRDPRVMMSKTQYLYRQPSNEQVNISRQMPQVSLIEN